MFIPADQISKRYLIIGVVLISVYPRMPFDKKCSVGGDLSRNFRLMLLAIVAINFSRLFLSGNEEFSVDLGLFSDFLGVIEVTALGFLCYVTPYILETKLAGYINLTPGAAFYGPLFASTLLNFLALLLSRTVHIKWYSLKKLGQAVSGPPVIASLKRFNFVTTSQSHGNGFMMGQATLAVEYWYIAGQILCFLGYALDRNHSSSDDDTWYDILLKAARSIAFMADWTRVCLHALFLNGIDEMNSMHVFTETQGTEDDVPLNPRTPQRFAPQIPNSEGEYALVASPQSGKFGKIFD